VRTTAYLTAASVALHLLARYPPASPRVLLPTAAVFAAFALDLRDEVRFLGNRGGRVRLLVPAERAEQAAALLATLNPPAI
jgi:hypothetical protein